ncbi:MAG: hypothetical protein P4L87_15265 [Formivibrio sp.]|nr:hypothetical protein [Formivibrio sp.]
MIEHIGQSAHLFAMSGHTITMWSRGNVILTTHFGKLQVAPAYPQSGNRSQPFFVALAQSPAAPRWSFALWCLSLRSFGPSRLAARFRHLSALGGGGANAGIRWIASDL